MSGASVSTDSFRVLTGRFGALAVDPDSVVTFPDGLVGFPDHRRYILVPHGDSPCFWLQSVEDGALAFPVTDPAGFLPGFRIDPTPEERARLELLPGEAPRFLVIVAVPPDAPTEIRLNVHGPLLVNPGRRRGIQIVAGPDRLPPGAAD